MPKYIVKSGDTKGKLARELGISINDEQFRSSDPNKLFAGEEINFGAPVQGPVQAPVQGPIQNGAVDLSKVQEGVQTFSEPSQSLRDISIAFSGKADQSQLEVIQERNPGLIDSTVDFNNSAPQEFQSTVPEEPTPEEKLSRTATIIGDEITALEEKLANSNQTRVDALDDAAVFDDLRDLNELKDELRASQDEEIEIGIKGRQQLRGKGATKTEFGQLTRPALEKNVLRSLAASRNASRLKDIIDTNISVIDTRLEAEKAKDEFIITQKQKRLDKVQSIYGDIMTEKQKQDAAAQKFKYDLLLEGVKSDNSLRNDLLKGLAKKGLSGENYMSMTIDELIGAGNDVVSPSRWSEMTFEEGATVLDKESFEKFEAYKNWDKTASEEEAAAVKESLAVTQSAQSIITTIEAMLDDKQGLKTSVGEGALGRVDVYVPFTGIGKESSAFRTNAKKLTAQKTLDQLLQIKAAGATLGAISEKELQILSDAATSLGAKYDGNGNATGKFELEEEAFATALKTMRFASMKTFIAGSIGKQAFANANYQNLDADNEEDFATLQKRYNDLRVNGVGQKTDFVAQDQQTQNANFEAAFNQIREEEGLRTDAYQDSTGTWTIGFGNTQLNGQPVKQGDSLTTEQAESLMQQSVIQKYTSFADKVGPQMTPNQFAALTSFEYNLGSGVWNQPTGQEILRLINSGDYNAAGQLMLQYNKSRNSVSGLLEENPVLAQRRAREANLLLS